MFPLMSSDNWTTDIRVTCRVTPCSGKARLKMKGSVVAHTVKSCILSRDILDQFTRSEQGFTTRSSNTTSCLFQWQWSTCKKTELFEVKVFFCLDHQITWPSITYLKIKITTKKPRNLVIQGREGWSVFLEILREYLLTMHAEENIFFREFLIYQFFVRVCNFI